MKKIILILIWLFAAKIGNTQTAMDSMLKIIRTSTIDSIRTDAAMNIVMPFGYMSPNAVLYYSDKLYFLAYNYFDNHIHYIS